VFARRPSVNRRWAVTRTRSVVLLILAFAGCVLGCGTPNVGHQRLGIRTRSIFGARLSIKARVSERANRNNPVAVALVLVYDDALMETLQTMTARDWFEKAEQIKLDFPEHVAFDHWAWEWVPGQEAPVLHVPLKDRPQKAVIFADYLSPGDHRARVDVRRDIAIQLREDGFTVTDL